MSTTGWIVIAVIVGVALWVMGVYNSLVALGQRVSQAFADIDVQLRQRHDLIPNLVETVKGYATHERGTLEAVVQARTSAVNAQGQDAKVAAENQLSGALGKLFALAEAYPDLKANTNFRPPDLIDFSMTPNRRLSAVRCQETEFPQRRGV
jgi:LemA protein